MHSKLKNLLYNNYLERKKVMMPNEIGLYDLFITQHEILDAMKQHGGSKVYYQNEEYEAFVGSDGVYLVKKDQNIFQRIFNIKNIFY